MSDSDFKNSPEYDDWIESGGRDEDYSYYCAHPHTCTRAHLADQPG